MEIENPLWNFINLTRYTGNLIIFHNYEFLFWTEESFYSSI